MGRAFGASDRFVDPLPIRAFLRTGAEARSVTSHVIVIVPAKTGSSETGTTRPLDWFTALTRRHRRRRLVRDLQSPHRRPRRRSKQMRTRAGLTFAAADQDHRLWLPTSRRRTITTATCVERGDMMDKSASRG